MSRMCRACGADNDDDREFCRACDRFIAWEGGRSATTARQASANGNGNGNGDGGVATTAVMAAAEPVPPALALRQPGDERDAGGPLTLHVDAGGEVTLIAAVRNAGERVDAYRVEVSGFANWWRADPQTFELMPPDSLHGYEREVAITLTPPRSSLAEAREWDVTVTVAAENSGLRTEQTVTVVIRPFEVLAVDATPRAVGGRRGAHLDLVVTNAGNAALPIGASGRDHEDRCVLTQAQEPVLALPGAAVPVRIAVRPKEPNWIGWKIDHHLQLTPKVAGEPRPMATTPAIYRQKPWVAWWMPIVLVLLLVVAVLIWLLLPDRVTVPDVRNAPSAFAAQQELEERDLTMAPDVRRVVRRGLRPGTVVNQAPGPGEEVDKGKAVAITVAVRRRRVRVPRLKSLTPAEADARLQRAGLTLGTVLPKLKPKQPVATQVPAAGAMRRRGTAVNVILAGAKVEVPKVVGLTPGKAEKKLASRGLKIGPIPPDAPKGAVVSGQVPAAQSQRPAGSVVTVVLAKAKAAGRGAVPEIKPGTAAEAAGAAAAKAGLAPRYVGRIATKPVGTVLSTDPEEGDRPPDKRVTIFVSVGFPRVAYDAGGNVATASLGREPSPLRAPGRQAEPAWMRDGRHLVFASRDRLAIAPPTGRGARRLREARDGDRPLSHPAIAPAPGPAVVAFVSGPPPQQLCFTRLFATRANATSCRAVPRLRISQLAWAADGSSILAVARPGRGLQPGLARFESERPFSAAAGDWQGGDRLETPPGRGVVAAAVSPDGGRLAVATRVALGGGYRIALIAPDDLSFSDVERVGVSGCDVAWRSDGLELAVAESGPRCRGAAGRVVRVRPGDPPSVRPVVAHGRNPSFEPLPTGEVTLAQLSALGRRR
jgi:beta-lactam-binding protein with PASTA domain